VPEWMTTTVEFLGIDFHLSNIARGVIDTRDVIYFFSMLGFTLLLSIGSLQRRNW
jgi:ABC-2 type transport system permease protein